MRYKNLQKTRDYIGHTHSLSAEKRIKDAGERKGNKKWRNVEFAAG